MSYKVLYLLVFFSSCVGLSTVKLIRSENLVIGEGLNDVAILNQSTVKSIRASFGRGKVVEYNTNFKNGSTSFRRLNYEKLGFEFEFKGLNVKPNDTLVSIILREPSKFFILDSICIGVERKVVERLLGEPISSKYIRKIDGSVYHNMLYNQVEFIFEETTFSPSLAGESKVQEIILW